MPLELASSRRETCVGDKHNEESWGLRTLQVVVYRPLLWGTHARNYCEHQVDE